jgi:hypothetical protein
LAKKNLIWQRKSNFIKTQAVLCLIECISAFKIEAFRTGIGDYLWGCIGVMPER